jgi:hypothetical protein
MRFDHAIIAATDLDQARAAYEEAGFSVIPGGVHSSGLTHNALVVFADGSYLELMAPTDPELLSDPPEPGLGNYLFMLDAGEGCAGYAFETDDLDGEVQRVRQAGFPIGDPESGGRRRADGIEIRWRTAMHKQRTMPFLITDETPRTDRVPHDPDGTAHHNGATGVAGVFTVVRDLDTAAETYAALLGSPPALGLGGGAISDLAGEPSPGEVDADDPSDVRFKQHAEVRTAEFQVGDFHMRLAEVSEATASYLEERGEFPLAIFVNTASRARAGSLEIHGAHIILEH